MCTLDVPLSGGMAHPPVLGIIEWVVRTWVALGASDLVGTVSNPSGLPTPPEASRKSAAAQEPG